MPLANLLAGTLKKNARRVDRRLDEYLKDPESEQSVHDIRTSLRRLQASFSLMPRKARKENARQIKACKDFFSANSKVRDCDIIRGRLAADGNFAALAPSLDRRRKAGLARALRLAKAMEKMPPVTCNADGKKLDKRIDRVAGRLVKRIEERVPVAAGDGSKKEELHELRKDLKKLRYVLEIVPAGHKRAHEKRLSSAIGAKRGVMPRLEELQDVLGAVHDADITIDFLKGSRRKEARALLQKEIAARDAAFQKFAKMFADT
jgi:CHAD domain-containing protein